MKHFRLLCAILFLLALSACDLETTLEDPAAAMIDPTVAATRVESESVEVYFTDPQSSLAAEERDGPDEALAAAIDAAQVSVDMAMFNLSLPSIRDALLAAQQRGLAVRLVVDDETYADEVSLQLRQAGITVVSDQREELMHNKFTIIDGLEVWTGSLNLSSGGTYSDYNNLVRIRSTRLAQDYSAEFEEMFLDGQFGSDSPVNTIYPRITLDGRTLEVYFLPEDDVEERLLELVGGAQHSVDFLAYSFTLDYLAETIIDLERAGVAVRGVMDANQVASNQGGEYDRLVDAGVAVRGVMDANQVASNQGGEYDRLVDAGVAVRLDPFEGLMHHKVILIDGQTVVFGSANFTRSGLFKNDENLIILADPQTAGSFEAEFERIYSLSQP